MIDEYTLANSREGIVYHIVYELNGFLIAICHQNLNHIKIIEEPDNGDVIKLCQHCYRRIALATTFNGLDVISPSQGDSRPKLKVVDAPKFSNNHRVRQ